MKSYKVAFNDDHSVFQLSTNAIRHLAKLGHHMAKASIDKPREAFDDSKLVRHDPLLIETIQELGRKASGPCANIWLAEIYTNCYKVKQFGGKEMVKEIKDPNTPNCIVIKDEDFLPVGPYVEPEAPREPGFYRMSECYYAIDESSFNHIIITPKEYWDANKKLDKLFTPHNFKGRTPKFLQNRFVMPAKRTLAEAKQQMAKLGFTYNSELEKAK